MTNSRVDEEALAGIDDLLEEMGGIEREDDDSVRPRAPEEGPRAPEEGPWTGVPIDMFRLSDALRAATSEYWDSVYRHDLALAGRVFGMDRAQPGAERTVVQFVYDRDRCRVSGVIGDTTT